MVLPSERAGTHHVFHQHVIRVRDRDSIRIRLREQGIDTALHYPLPVHLQDVYRGRLAMVPSKLADTEALAGEILSLPIYPQLEEGSVTRVIEAVCGVLSSAQVEAP